MSELVIRDEAQYLATVDEVRALCEQITTAEGAEELAAKARAAEVWGRRVKLSADKVALAVAARLWAERRYGQIIGPATPGRGKGKESDRKSDSEYKQRQRSRQLADVPDEAFAEAVEAGVKDGKLNGEAVLKRVGRSKRDEEKQRERREAEAEARESGLTWEVAQADLREWRPARVDAIVTDPPYITADAVELHSALADFAVDVLPDGGTLIVMTWQPLLPAVFTAMSRPELVYRWMLAWTFETNERTPDRARRVFDGWKPVLVFHKGTIPPEATYLYDLVRSENLDKDSHEWGQSIGGFRRLVKAACRPGETVCDPFVGGGTTAVAALAEGCHFTGCDIDENAVATARARLA